jgi:hypothetical protein
LIVPKFVPAKLWPPSLADIPVITWLWGKEPLAIRKITVDMLEIKCHAQRQTHSQVGVVNDEQIRQALFKKQRHEVCDDSSQPLSQHLPATVQPISAAQ